jgi:hypothetical protein
MPLSPSVNIGIQIGVALIVLLIMYIVTLAVLNIDSIVNTPSIVIKQKETTVLLDGYAGPTMLTELQYNTVNPYVENYKRIARSANQNSGASFTYQFWLKVENPDDNLFKNLTLIHKGDRNNYRVGYYEPVDSDARQFKLIKKLPPAPYVACPSISFGRSYKELVVYFNSNKDVANAIHINMDVDREPSARKNLLSLLPVNWTLLTFVFQDNYSFTQNSENGIKFTFYVNDVPYWTETSSSAPLLKDDVLVQNDGDVSFLPNAKNTTEFMKMGNVKYYNYALNQSEVSSVFQNGPPTYAASKTENLRAATPAYIGALNKIDIYNY